MNCNHCGTTLPEGVSVCTVCGTPVQAASAGPEILPVRENVGLGILGAIGGALIGGASIILLSRLGFIAAISGFLIAFCTLKGYELLGKKLSNFGIIICILVMLAAPMIAFVFDEAIFLVKNWNMGFGDAMEFIIESIKSGLITFEEIMERVGKVYLFAAIGAVGIIINAFQKNKK